MCQHQQDTVLLHVVVNNRRLSAMESGGMTGESRHATSNIRQEQTPHNQMR